MVWCSKRLCVYFVFIFALLYYVKSSSQRVFKNDDDFLRKKPWWQTDDESDEGLSYEDDDEPAIGLNDWKDCPCGSRVFKEKNHQRIINGEDVNDLRKFPWVVSLFNKEEFKKGDTGWGDCGAIIIYPRYILTAAHCFRRFNFTADKHMIGLKGPDVTKPSVLIDVVEIIVHPKFDPFNLFIRGDIALAKLKKAITCCEYNRPICLPSKVIYQTGDDVLIAGWGFIDPEPNWIRPRTLQEATVQIMERKECKAIWKDIFCTIGDNGILSCAGDSGSSLIMEYEGKFYTIGITSVILSMQCAYAPVGYIDIVRYLPFIEKHTQE